MTEKKSRISYLAIASLICGMVFFVPIVTGFLAVLFGILAIQAIKNSQNFLLGKGLAYSGVVLGFIHGAFWILVFSTGLTYIVDIGDQAVVIRGGVVNRIEESGLHYKIPFLESVERYPTETIQSLKSSTGSLLFSSRDTATLNYNLLWRVCSPALTYKATGPFNKEFIELRLSLVVEDLLRVEAAKKHDYSELAADWKYIGRVEERLNKELSSLGVCIIALNIEASQNIE